MYTINTVAEKQKKQISNSQLFPVSHKKTQKRMN